MFNIITGINEWKTLAKRISCECKCKFDGRKCNSNQKLNDDKCLCECKKHNVCEKEYILNPVTCSKYLANITDDLVIMCDEIIDAEVKSYYEETKTITTNFNEKKVFCRTQNFTYIFINNYSIIDSC